MTMTKPNASADAEKNHAGYYKKTLQRRKCSNSSAKYRTYHGTELLRTEHKAKNASALVGRTRLAIEAVCGALHLPTCARQFPRDIGRERPCLNHHIGRCDGFCRPDGPGQAEYQARIRQAVRIFNGHYRQLTAELQQEMEQAAEELNFEKAAALRDRIRAISVLGKTQQVIAGVCADTDVWGVYPGQVRCGSAVLHIEDGNLLGREVEVFSAAADQEEADILSAVLSQYYLDRQALPREILVPCELEDMDTFAALLTGRAGHRVILRVPQRGERAELLRMARRNAREEVERITSDAERTGKTLEQLGSARVRPAAQDACQQPDDGVRQPAYKRAGHAGGHILRLRGQYPRRAAGAQ